MNIAMFTNTYRPLVGGIEKSIETFTQMFRARGNRTLVVAPQFEGAEDSDVLELRVPSIIKAAGSPYSVLLPIPGGVNDRLDLFAPDLLHSHQPFMLGDVALRAARKRRVPLIFTHHTLYERYAYLLSGFDQNTVERVARQLPTEYANLCDLVIAPTEGIGKLIRSRGVTVPVEVVPTGINVSFYAGGDRAGFRQKFGIGETTFVAGHLGRLNPGKNLGYLADAAIAWLKESEDGLFLLVGEGESAQELENRFHEAGVGEQLLYVGKQTGQASADAYAAMDVFLFASKTDTQGLVLLESMAAGVPVLALEAFGVQEVIKNDHNGLQVPTDAGETAFAAEIGKLEKDRDRFERWREGAHKTVVEYDQERCADRMVTLYEAVLADWKREEPAALTPWEEFVESVQVEWDLIGEKAAIARTLFPWAGPKGKEPRDG